MSKKTWKPRIAKRQKMRFSSLTKSDETTLLSRQRLVITNVECLSKEDVIALLSSDIRQKDGQTNARWFVYLCEHARYKADILNIGKEFIEIDYQDAVENCLYCEDELQNEALYCNDVCASLATE